MNGELIAISLACGLCALAFALLGFDWWQARER